LLRHGSTEPASLNPVSHQTGRNPPTQLIGPQLAWRPAWTAFREAASRRNGPPVQYRRRQRQLSQLQRDVRSSWRWLLHRPHRLTGTLQNGSRALLDLALERLLARRPGLHPRQSGRARRNGPRSIPSGKFPKCVGSALQMLPRPNGVTIRSQGTKAPVKTLEA
jgi:hypothetical protein